MYMHVEALPHFACVRVQISPMWMLRGPFAFGLGVRWDRGALAAQRNRASKIKNKNAASRARKDTRKFLRGSPKDSTRSPKGQSTVA